MLTVLLVLALAAFVCAVLAAMNKAPVLALAAFVCAVLAAMNKAPLWVAVILLCLIALLQQLPLGR